MSEEKKVEQDERGSISKHDAKGLEIIASWMDRDGLIQPAEFLRSLAARAASTSANVAQGAEGVHVHALREVSGGIYQCKDCGAIVAAPPAQKALTTEQITDIRRAAVLIRENSYPCPDKPHSNWALADRIDKIVSGDKS